MFSFRRYLVIIPLALCALGAGLWIVRASHVEPVADGGGSWRVLDDGAGSVLIDNRGLTLVPAPAVDSTQARSAMAVLDSDNQRDYSYSMRLATRRLPDNAGPPVVRLLVRYTRPTSGYYVSHSAAGLELGKLDETGQVVLARLATPARAAEETNDYYVDAKADTLRVFVDGQLWISYDDPQPILSGRAGIAVQGVQAVVTNAYLAAIDPAQVDSGTAEGIGRVSYARTGVLIGSPLPTLIAAPESTPSASPVVAVGGQELSPAPLPSLPGMGGPVGWGSNAAGQLGGSPGTGRTTPDAIAGLDDAKALAAGRLHSLAADHSGNVWTWGANTAGQLGDGTTQVRTRPVSVQHLDTVTRVAAGDDFSLALKVDGTVWAWGGNSSGQLGDGTTQDRVAPVLVQGLDNVSRIAAGHAFSLALKADGTVWAWGANEAGQLGDGTNVGSPTPVRVREFVGVQSIAAGEYFSLALKSDGSVWAWGADEYGQLGQGSPSPGRNAPVPLTGLGIMTAIAAGGYHALAVDPRGTTWAWGANWYGQLAQTTTEVCGRASRQQPCGTLPRTVPGLDRAVASVAAGESHSLALAADGSVWAWGLNTDGELGDGTGSNSVRPVQVIGLGPQLTIAAGGQHSLAAGRARGGSETHTSALATR